MAKVTKDMVFENLFKPLYKTNKALEIYYLTGEVMDGPMYMKKRVILNPGIYCEAEILYPDHPEYGTYEGYLEIGLNGKDSGGMAALVREPFSSWEIEELKAVYDRAMGRFRKSLNNKIKMIDIIEENAWDENKFEVGPDNKQKGWSILEVQTEEDRS